MRTRNFLAYFLLLVILALSFYCYRVQTSVLVVEAYFDLSVRRESSDRPGFGWIIEQNISVSLVRWPEVACEEVDVVPRHSFNETRKTPVRFVVCLYLNQTRKDLMMPSLNTTGSYTAIISSFFSNINQGTYNLTITFHVLGFDEDQDRLQRFITIP